MMKTDRRGFFCSLASFFLGGVVAVTGKTITGCMLLSGPSIQASRHEAVSDTLLASGLANYGWHYQGPGPSGYVVSYRDRNTVDMIVEVNGEEISVPVDQYYVQPGDTVTVTYL